MTLVRPMKADNKEYDLAAMLEKAGHFQQTYLQASRKMDGIRGLVKGGVVMSNSMKPIPSAFVQRMFGSLEGLDGELICGEPNAADVYTKTFSAVMTHGSETPVNFHVFDKWNMGDPYYIRQDAILEYKLCPNVLIVEQFPVVTIQEITEYEDMVLAEGFEGLMLRRPDRPYKFGRSTNLQGHLIKLKRIIDAEAQIQGFEELLHNGNEAQTSAMGYTVRTAHKANKVGMNTLGAIQVTGINEPFKDVPFKIGVFKGFDKYTLQQIWDNQTQYLGRIVRFQYFGIGVKDAPRHPRMTGFRAAEDL